MNSININSPGVGQRSIDFFSPTNILIGIISFICIFFALREFLCWYWKINKIVDLLEDIKNNTSSEKKISILPPVKAESLVETAHRIATPVQVKEIRSNYFKSFFSKGNKTNQVIIELLLFALIIAILYFLLPSVFKVI